MGNDAPPVPWVPGVAFPVQHGTGSISKISGGVPAVEKTGAFIFPGTRGTLSVVNLDRVCPKNYRRGYLVQKIQGTMRYPGFPEKIRCMRVTGHGVPYILVNLILHYFYKLLCYKTGKNNVDLCYKPETSIEHARRYDETREWI